MLFNRFQPQVRVMMIGAEDEENLAIRYLGAALNQAGYQAMVNPCSRYEDFEQALWNVHRFQPQLIGISIAFQSLAMMYFDLAEKIKASYPDVHIVVGGHFPTFEYEKILKTQKPIASVGRFEGEKTMVELAEFLVDKKQLDQVTNLVYRKNGGISENQCYTNFFPLDELAWPMREKKPQERLDEKFATLISSRGCWHSSCLYCCIGAFHAQKPIKFKLREPKSVAEEIADLFFRKQVRFFQFHDDNFMMPSKTATISRIKDLHKWIVKFGVPIKQIAFLIKARPDTVDDQVVKWLKKLRTVGVFLGIENASQSGLKALCRRTNIESNQRALMALHKQGIAATYNLLIFHPQATAKEVKENVEFMNSFNVFPYDFGRAEVCAGTPLENMLKKKNKLRGKWPNWDYKIENDKVNRMCKVYKQTFRDKNTGYSNLVHLNIALGYNAKLIARLHPGLIQKKLTKDADKLIMEINQFIGKQVTELSSTLDNKWTAKQVRKFKERLSVGCKKRVDMIEELNKKISRLVTAEHIFEKFNIEKNSQKVVGQIPYLF